MPVYRSTGGGAPITTRSEITDYSTGNGGSAPRYGKHGSTDRIQHALQAPKGEKPLRYNDATPPKHSESGSNYAGFKAGKSAAPGVETSKRGAALDRAVPRGIPNRDRFNQTFGTVGCGEGGSAKGGVSYQTWDGKTRSRGKSG